ncbi:MAG: PAS domain S-box protein [Gemmatimonadales bacterium]
MAAFTRSLAISGRWGTVQAEISELGEALSALDAPANDVFASGNIAAEREHLAGAEGRVGRAIFAVRQGPLEDSTDHIAVPLMAQIDSVEVIVGAVDRGARAVFAALGHNRRTDAEQAMAEMDHAYIGALAHLRKARAELELVQRVLLQNQDQVTRQVNLLGRWIAAALLALSLAVVLTGLRLDRRSRAATEDRVTTLQRLATAEAELRRALERLTRTAEARYHSLVESAPDAIVALDLAGRVESVNPAFETITGWSEAEVRRRPIAELGHPDDRGGLSSLVAAAVGGAGPTPVEVRLLRPDGRKLVAECTAAPERDGNTVHGALLMVRDVTERRRVEDELRRSEERYRKLITYAPEGIYTLDLKGEVTTVNPALERLFGGIGRVTLGRNFREFVHPDDLPSSVAANEQRLRGQLPYDGAPALRRLRRADGSYFEAEVTSGPMFGADGTVIGVLGILRDVSERRRVERDLALSEERYRLLVEHAPDIIYRLRQTGEIASINPAVERITGFSPIDIVGRHFADFTHPDDLAEALANNQRTMSGEPVQSIVLRIRRADGSYFDGEITSSAIADGKAGAGVLGMMRDVTAIRRAAREEAKLTAALQAAAQDWMLTFDAVNIGLVVLDPEERIHRLNRAARDYAGLNFDELIGRKIGEVGLRSPWTEAAELAAAAAETEEVLSEQIDHDLQTHSWSLTAVHYRVPDGDRVIMTIRDITELMELRRALERNETMSTLGVLVAGVAHEVRNPLFAISATLDAFEVRYQGQAEYRDLVTLLRPEVERLSQLMHDLLEYGRPPELHLERCDLRPVLLAARDRTLAIAAQRGVRLEMRIAAGLPLTVVDPSRLLQVYQNVIDNAVQHAPRDTTVEVTLDLVRQNGAPWLRCCVLDHGPGFNEAELSKVFDPFFTRRQGGTGLGLSIVQRLTELHHGTVTASNHEQGGALMTLLIPVTDA